MEARIKLCGGEEICGNLAHAAIPESASCVEGMLWTIHIQVMHVTTAKHVHSCPTLVLLSVVLGFAAVLLQPRPIGTYAVAATQ